MPTTYRPVSLIFQMLVIGMASFQALGEQAPKCNADEIHWTITGPNSATFDWRGKAAQESSDMGCQSDTDWLQPEKLRHRCPSRLPAHFAKLP